MATDKQLRELAKTVEETGMSIAEVIRHVRAVQSGTFSKVVEHEKYGWQIEIYGPTHKPFSLSRNKATSAKILADDIAAFVDTTEKPATKLRKAS